MKVSVINGSIRKENTSQIVSRAVVEEFLNRNIDVEMITLEAFSDIFIGDYINEETANELQKEVLSSLKSADILLFVVPTYYKAMPGILKNFFDIVRIQEIYDKKVIGFVANSRKNQDDGANETFVAVRGILQFFQAYSLIIPEVEIINSQQVDHQLVEHCVTMAINYRNMLK